MNCILAFVSDVCNANAWIYITIATIIDQSYHTVYCGYNKTTQECSLTMPATYCYAWQLNYSPQWILLLQESIYTWNS